MNTILKAALESAARGWPVFPTHWIENGACSCGNPKCPKPGKHPKTKHGFYDATTDKRQLRDWWKEWPSANLARRTGKEGGGITVVDADCANGKPGLANLERLCAPHGGVPPTRSVETGSGGRHFYFKFSPELRTGENRIDTAIDVKNDGGYVVAPPSLHLSGNFYRWLNDVEELALPEWMRPVARQKSAASEKRRHYTLQQIEHALEHIDSADREKWRDVGVILGREYQQRSEAWKVYETWSATWPRYGEDVAANLTTMREAFYDISREKPDSTDPLTLGSLIHWAIEGGWSPQTDDDALDDFYAIHPAGKCLFVPSGQLWTPQAVNDALPPILIGKTDKGKPLFEAPAKWLARNRGIESVVFDPSLPQIVEGKVARQQGVVEHPGARLLNLYMPPKPEGGDAAAAGPFVEHVRKIIPDAKDAEHVLAWLAQRVQQPGTKVRHALVLGGPPGIGKDTIVDAVVPAIGAWNVANIAPDDIFRPFTEYRASVLVRINEVADLHAEVSRFKFYEATKNLIAGTPDWTEVNPKYGHKFWVKNCAGVVLTTNYINSGMYLSPDDRRHFVAATVELNELAKTPEARKAYFVKLWEWLFGGGFLHVAAFLRAYDLSAFKPDAEPPKSAAFFQLVTNSASPDAWLLDALDMADPQGKMELTKEGQPKMVRADQLSRYVTSNGKLTQQEFAVRLAPTMARIGYEPYRNEARKDGRFNFDDGKARSGVYVLKGLVRCTPDKVLKALLVKLGGQI